MLCETFTPSGHYDMLEGGSARIEHLGENQRSLDALA